MRNDKKVNFATAPISIGHTFGNMTANVVNMVKNLFSPEYFKTVNVSSKVAHRYFNILNSNNASEFMKKNKPFLIIRPRVELLTEDTFLAGTYLTTRLSNNFDGGDWGNLMQFYSDPKNAIESRFLMNRHRMSFDVMIVVESMMEQINIGEFLKNRVRWNMPMNLNYALECQIPHTIIKGISRSSGIDYTNTPEFLTHMNAHSAYPITYKMKTSTGHEEFFRYYQAQVDAMYSNLSLDDGSRKGMVEDAYAISFTVDMEFEGAGMYHLFSKDGRMIRDITFESRDAFVSNDGSVIDLLFTQPNIFDEELLDGWELYAAPSYKVESSKKPDVLDLSNEINNTILSVIDFHIEKGISLGSLLEIKVLKDDDYLVEDKDYILDLKRRKLTTLRVNTLSTYRIIITINVTKINEMAIELLDREDK